MNRIMKTMILMRMKRKNSR